MASTFRSSADAERGADWRSAGLRYHAYSFFLRRRFGFRVHKVSVDAGFDCPNVDGTLGTDGCVFCDNRSFSPSRRAPRRSLRDQIDEAAERLGPRFGCEHFLAYFQPATNTYAPVEVLRSCYEQALAHPQVVGLAIGTRPDCVPDPVLDLLEEYAGRTYVCLELGLQSTHDRSLAWIGRRHRYDAFLDAVSRARGRGFAIGAHVILGLPGETRDDVRATARELARLQLDAVKLHNLYAVRNTPLAEQVLSGRVSLPERDAYIARLIDVLEDLPPSMVIERLSGDAPREFLLAPSWCLDKAALRESLLAEMARLKTWQGRNWRDE